MFLGVILSYAESFRFFAFFLISISALIRLLPSYHFFLVYTLPSVHGQFRVPLIATSATFILARDYQKVWIRGPIELVQIDVVKILHFIVALIWRCRLAIEIPQRVRIILLIYKSDGI